MEIIPIPDRLVPEHLRINSDFQAAFFRKQAMLKIDELLRIAWCLGKHWRVESVSDIKRNLMTELEKLLNWSVLGEFRADWIASHLEHTFWWDMVAQNGMPKPLRDASTPMAILRARLGIVWVRIGKALGF